jgi:hypothetical protein
LTFYRDDGKKKTTFILVLLRVHFSCILNQNSEFSIYTGSTSYVAGLQATVRSEREETRAKRRRKERVEET